MVEIELRYIGSLLNIVVTQLIWTPYVLWLTVCGATMFILSFLCPIMSDLRSIRKMMEEDRKPLTDKEKEDG